MKMKNNFIKWIEVFKTAELNRNTEDVDQDLKHLHISETIKYRAYYLFFIALGFWLYFYGIGVIKEDPFRKELIIEANVSPIMTFLYSDYKTEKEKAEKEKESLQKKIIVLYKKNKETKPFHYEYTRFLNDVRSNGMAINFEKILEKDIPAYMEKYFLSYLEKNKENNISIRGKEFTLLAISEKVKPLQKFDAFEKLKLPATVILDSLKMKQNKTNIDALSNSLYRLSSLDYRNATFYKNVNIDKNATKALSSAILNNKTKYLFDSKLYTSSINLPNLQNEYKKQYKIEKEKYQKTKEKREAKREVNKKNAEKIKTKIDLLSSLIQQIKNLQINVVDYKQNKETVEKILGELKWN
jgi:hypothetical protein